jgi:cytochrome c oxidase subunit 2
MPTYQGQISEEGIIALVEYIKNLNSDYRIQQTLNTTELPPENAGEGNAAAQPAPSAKGRAPRNSTPRPPVSQPKASRPGTATPPETATPGRGSEGKVKP